MVFKSCRNRFAGDLNQVAQEKTRCCSGKRRTANAQTSSDKPLTSSMNPVQAPLEAKLRHVFNFHCEYAGSWNQALKMLRCLVSPDRDVILDGFLEYSLVWAKYRKRRHEKLRTMPWIGFLHCPPGVPHFLHSVYQALPEYLLSSRTWSEIVPWCRGVFCLSRHHRQWLESVLTVPVSNLHLPTRSPGLAFDLDHYLQKPRRGIVQVGTYLRRLSSICQLPTRKLRKMRLASDAGWVTGAVALEKANGQIALDSGNVRELGPLSIAQFDRLLSENLVFTHLYGSSANNTIVECIVRQTPILVNPLPAVQEYLGVDYPLYFCSLEEAAAKAEDTQLIARAHRYLLDLSAKDFFTPARFLRDFLDSPVYSAL